MAALNRQLQEYLSQSKGGGGGAKAAAPSSSSTAVELGEPEPVPGSWFGRWSSPRSSEPEPCVSGLGRRQRLVLSGLLASLSGLCFGLAALYAPLLLLHGRRFALLWSFGSALAAAAAGVLLGPGRLLSGLRSSPAAAAYLCALGATLYAALGLRSTALTALGAGLQLCLLLGSVVALLPGGSAGLRLLGGLLASSLRRAGSTI